MEIIRLTEDNIEELVGKLEQHGFDDFSSIIKNQAGLEKGLIKWNFGEQSSTFYRVRDNWEFVFENNGSLTIRRFGDNSRMEESKPNLLKRLINSLKK